MLAQKREFFLKYSILVGFYSTWWCHYPIHLQRI